MKPSVAGAPVSFGVFEMTPEGADTLQADDILDVLAETGYDGVDLGPVGFLGRGNELRTRLARHGLELAGGWVELPLTDNDAFRAALNDLDDALRIFDDAAQANPARLPKPTLADSGSVARRAAPGSHPEPLTDAGWDALARNAEIASERVRNAGLEPTFHHHAGTFVESPDEIETFLERVDIGLTLDTGHLLIGGGDALDAIRRWGTRINHVHLKDVNKRELRNVLDTHGGMREVWSSPSFVPFGDGDIDIPAVLSALNHLHYDGWIVVEQDVLPRADTPLQAFRRQRKADHEINRAALRPWR